MIGKQDWCELAEQIVAIEEQMFSGYQQLAEQVSDAELKTLFSALCKDETNHAHAIRHVLNSVVESS